MADLDWPADLVPYRVAFYLQPHVGGQESPLTRTRKVYGLSAPRWVAKLTFRGGYAGDPLGGDQAGYGPRLDAMLADLEGGLNRVLIWDFRRPRPARAQRIVQELACQAVPAGASGVAVAGFAPGSVAFSVGDYLGGDGRPHIVTRAATLAAGGVMSGVGHVVADAGGVAVVGFTPPLRAPIADGAPLPWPVTGRFRLTSDDAGQNETAVGDLTEYPIDFVEDLLP